MMSAYLRAGLAALTACLLAPFTPLAAQEVVFTNVRVFDGTADSLSAPTTVVVRGNVIAAIGPDAAPAAPEATIIDGTGQTLMPGLIDNHVHMMFNSLSPAEMAAPDMSLEKVMALSAAQSRAMLLRGFTAVRDVGGPSFELKRLIDSGKVIGPRIWPSGPMISQTSGHAEASNEADELLNDHQPEVAREEAAVAA